MDLLEEYGWQLYFSKNIESCEEKNRVPARVVFEQKGMYGLVGQSGEMWGKLSGKLCFEITDAADLPAVGDWVMVEKRGAAVVIHCVLPRKSVLIRNRVDSNRKNRGLMDRQVLAANVDTAFILSSITEEFNPRRIERFLTLAWNGDVRPVILLTKADLCEDPEQAVRDVEGMGLGVAVEAVSAHSPQYPEFFTKYHGPGQTAVLLGPSGVGKSSLINRLMNREVQAVQTTRKGDGKGRHTTTSRQLFRQEDGGMAIDTPGLRAVGISDEADDLSGVFEDVDQLAVHCRFRDCRHQNEPGCAVLKAVKTGRLDPKRLDNYRKLQKEAVSQEHRRNKPAMKKEQKRFAKMVAEVKKHPKGMF